jgi:hypothetical protein
MSIVSGLVGGATVRTVATSSTVVGHWAMRNAWGVILLSSLAFWAAIAAAVVLA